MKTARTLSIVCYIALLSGVALALPHTCIPGCCNGVLKDSGGNIKGTCSDWKAYADGTTDGIWEYDSSYGNVVSDDAAGTYTYNPFIPLPTAEGIYTGTAYFPTHPEYGTSSYTMTLTLYLPGGDYCYGDYDIDFTNSQWPDIYNGQWEHTSICASPMADHVSEVIIDSGIDDYFNSSSISHNFDIEIITDDTVNSITFTSPGTPGVASGITFTITKTGYQDPTNNIDAGYYYDSGSDTHEWYYFQGVDDPADLSKYGNGWYDITVNYVGGGSDSTKIWFNLLAEDTPIPAPTQMINLTSHTNRQRTESPVTLKWNPTSDANAKNIWISLEKMPDGDEIDIELPVSAVSSDPIALDDGYWQTMIGFDHYYNFPHNADGIPYSVGRYTEKGYLIGVGIVSELTGSSPVDAADLVIVASSWLSDDCNDSNNYCDRADINFDTHVNLNDLSDIARDWLK